MIRFADKQHEAFYLEQIQRLRDDVYHRALIYTLGISPDTRKHFSGLYDPATRTIKRQAIRAPWQTGGSLKVTRLAFQLFTDSTPTAYDGDNRDFQECFKYSVSDIFCTGYAPYFVQAIQLRYPEYFQGRVC